MNKLTTILVALVAFVAAGCGDETEFQTTPTQEMSANTPANMGKGDSIDDAEQATESERPIDLCVEFELYGDGECHTFCETPDSDCTEEELEAARDVCEEEGRYGDGQCDTDCRGYDIDCDEPVDACFMEARYADGSCDTDCFYTDADCEDYEPSTERELSDDEESMCGRLRREARVNIRDLATSICMERDDARMVDCIVQCIDAASNR